MCSTKSEKPRCRAHRRRSTGSSAWWRCSSRPADPSARRRSIRASSCRQYAPATADLGPGDLRAVRQRHRVAFNAAVRASSSRPAFNRGVPISSPGGTGRTRIPDTSREAAVLPRPACCCALLPRSWPRLGRDDTSTHPNSSGLCGIGGCGRKGWWNIRDKVASFIARDRTRNDPPRPVPESRSDGFRLESGVSVTASSRPRDQPHIAPLVSDTTRESNRAGSDGEQHQEQQPQRPEGAGAVAEEILRIVDQPPDVSSHAPPGPYPGPARSAEKCPIAVSTTRSTGTRS